MVCAQQRREEYRGDLNLSGSERKGISGKKYLARGVWFDRTAIAGFTARCWHGICASMVQYTSLDAWVAEEQVDTILLKSVRFDTHYHTTTKQTRVLAQ